LQLLAARLVDHNLLITHTFPVTDALRAFSAAFEKASSQCLRAVVMRDTGQDDN